MKLKRGGVVFDVDNPTEIARLKRAGFKEVTNVDFAAEQQATADAAVGGGSVVIETKQPEAKSTDATSKKGKGKK